MQYRKDLITRLRCQGERVADSITSRQLVTDTSGINLKVVVDDLLVIHVGKFNGGYMCGNSKESLGLYVYHLRTIRR